MEAMPPDRDHLLPDKKKYSVVKFDSWKAPDDDDFMYKVGEIDSLDDDPITSAGRGVEILVYDEEGTLVSQTVGPEHPTETTTRDS